MQKIKQISNRVNETIRVTLETKDGVKLAGVFKSAGEGAPAAVLLHMMPATKESWSVFAEKLKKAGFSSLAIDFRGHGESLDGPAKKKLDYKKFSDREHQEKIKDVEAAVGWLAETAGAEKSKITVIGASIGANLTLKYLSTEPRVKAGVLLSPGLNYRGVETPGPARLLKEGQAVFYAAAKDDGHSFETMETLDRITTASHETKKFESGGHGTELFKSHPELMDELVNWLKQALGFRP